MKIFDYFLTITLIFRNELEAKTKKVKSNIFFSLLTTYF